MDTPSLMLNPIRAYAWGSHRAIASMQGRPAASAPEAELWMGAHPSAPSELRVDGSVRSLLACIEQAPEQVLGADVLARFGPRLPFLLKVLAADEPLSLQAHPTAEQAVAGYRAEEARGIPRGAPERTFADPSAKPELLCALTDFDVLCGFRELGATADLLDRLDTERLRPLASALRGDDGEHVLRTVMARLLTWPAPDRGALVSQVTAAAQRVGGTGGPLSTEAACVARLGAAYPADPGVVCALLLNLVRLGPGEAVYLPAGHLHAYLRGVGVEVMGSSDNVLRGGLTPKHVDVAELQRVLVYRAGPVARVPVDRLPTGEEVFRTPAPDFRLSRIRLRPGDDVTLTAPGPQVLLCVEGEAEVGSGPTTTVPAGHSAFVPAAAGAVRLRGRGLVFRAAVPPSG